ncbi:hypothetical protein FHS61_001256 [Altererythrobacter atlanticus]|uniref:Uncharacterized protein n=1 Tax=Croceibacterium atlanticum TaxID=1267766 RepID=A0A0F7KW81_9SPHN|nr:hypothetical protein WYH_02010 [Croceibacterium atlanticum]MBB5732252.1 hypothetical protein [Croceibacterium atlanticum]
MGRGRNFQQVSNEGRDRSGGPGFMPLFGGDGVEVFAVLGLRFGSLGL